MLIVLLNNFHDKRAITNNQQSANQKKLKQTVLITPQKSRYRSTTKSVETTRKKIGPFDDACVWPFLLAPRIRAASTSGCALFEYIRESRAREPTETLILRDVGCLVFLCASSLSIRWAGWLINVLANSFFRSRSCFGLIIRFHWAFLTLKKCDILWILQRDFC